MRKPRSLHSAPRPMPHSAPRIAPPQRGFIYMALLVFFGVFVFVAGAAMISGATLQRRTGEEQLIFVGGEFRRAIESYYLASASAPPGSPRYPEKLDDLLADPRNKELKRHLRQIYPDPLMGNANWATVPAPGGGIMGVYSRSPAKAVKLFGFPAEFKYLEGKQTIAEWKFLYIAPTLPDIEAAAKAIGAPATALPAPTVVPAPSPAPDSSSNTTAAAPAPAPPAAAPTPAPATPPATPPAKPGSDDPMKDLSPADKATLEALAAKLKELEKVLGGQ